jgi:hypothetical protein
MSRRRGLAALAVVAALVGLSACGTPGAGRSSDPAPDLMPLSAVLSKPVNWTKVLHSKQKLFGISISGAPASLAPIHKVTQEVHKAPDAVLYYQDWADAFDPDRAQHACQAGMLPVLTWESWSWKDTTDGHPSYSQPAYAPRRIAHGAYDSYIRATARAVKKLNCTIMIRFDHEANGYWYPWGLGAAGMHNTPAQYVAMWRHVWKIFHAAHVKNALWCWSPNLILPRQPYPLAKLYPGNKYVDAVGLDGYLLRPTDTPRSVLGPLMTKLHHIAPKRPWFVSETGVASGSHQPAGIRSMLHFVAHNKHLHGFVYLDEKATRADWSFGSNSASVRAFRNGIARHVYGHART